MTADTANEKPKRPGRISLRAPPAPPRPETVHECSQRDADGALTSPAVQCSEYYTSYCHTATAGGIRPITSSVPLVARCL